MSKFVIIGNGFDLAHNLPTSYADFLESIFTGIIDEDKFPELASLKIPPTSKREIMSDPLKYLSFKSDLFKNLSTKLTSNWVDIEISYFKLLRRAGNRLDVIKVNDEFETIKNHLNNYLNNLNTAIKPIISYKLLFSKLKQTDTYFINFNYTNLLSLYRIPTTNIINIHGQLNTNKNPLIFGYAADKKDMTTLTYSSTNEIYQNIKRMNYSKTNNYQRVTEIIRGPQTHEAYILGHSLGLSDKLILNDILSSTRPFGINIFYHEKYEDYFNKICNIDRIIEIENSQKHIEIFPKSSRMPQHNDDQKNQDIFEKFIAKL